MKTVNTIHFMDINEVEIMSMDINSDTTLKHGEVFVLTRRNDNKEVWSGETWLREYRVVSVYRRYEKLLPANGSVQDIKFNLDIFVTVIPFEVPDENSNS